MKLTAFSLAACAHFARWTLCAFWLFAATGAEARAIDDIRLSRIGTESTIEIELGCSMRYISHTPARSGSVLRVTMAVGQDCRLTLANVSGELRRPVGGRMAHLYEIEFEHDDRREAVVTLRFDAAVGFQIRQTSNRYMLTVVVDTSNVSAPQQPTPVVRAPPADEPVVERAEPSDREPGRRVPVASEADRNRFALRVAVISEAETIDFDALRQFDSLLLYTNEIAVGGRRWAELRIGFFDTEADAQRALQKLGPAFSSAWITIANADEQTQARARRFAIPDAVPDTPPLPPATEAILRPERAFSDQQIEALLIEAQGAYLSGSFAESIDIYTRLLAEPGGAHRRKARELLGVAYQKDGQFAQARAEYEAFLTEFPDGADARRVRQRLASFTVPVVEDRETVALQKPASTEPTWEFYGSASQHYLRGVSMGENSSPDFVAQSAVLSQALVAARYRGQRFELAGRANVGYLYDFVEDGADDQALVSHAYVDISDTKLELDARIGRQSRHSGGVLGRFDGVHASYRLRPQMSINVTAGFPIDSPRFLSTTDHYFYGASIDLDNIIGALDLQAFTHLQTIDGIDDRKAFGAEAQYHKDGLNIVGLIDYDASYNVLNTGLITANWRFHDRLTLRGRYRGGAAPFLTTRNAIIGQHANTVRELMPFYSEGQIRRLARNRTAEERAGSVGLDAALTTRLQLKTDFSYSEYSNTVASGGVDALPESGPRYSWGGHLIGSGFGSAGNVFMLGYRHDESRSVDTDTVWLDIRNRLGSSWRIQSRIAVSNRVANQNLAGDIEQWIARPVLRLHYLGTRRLQIEFEVGGQWSNREFPQALAPPLTPDSEYEATDYYVQLGYTMDF